MIRIIRCREISELMDADKVPQLNFVDRMQYRVHIWTCWHCRRLERQIRWLRKIAAEHLNQIVDADSELEARLLKKMSGE